MRILLTVRWRRQKTKNHSGQNHMIAWNFNGNGYPGNAIEGLQAIRRVYQVDPGTGEIFTYAHDCQGSFIGDIGAFRK